MRWDGKKRLGTEVCLLVKASGNSNASTRQKRLRWGDMKEEREGERREREEGKN